jgi:putative PIN family toxin of toxin-antitoxin system
LKLVLDTNIWLDWLVFDDPSVAPLRERVERGQAEIFIDEACEAELERVLGYPFQKRFLDGDRQRACLAECRRIARRIVAGAAPKPALPKCGDPDDQKFLEAALAAGADFLVTKDLALIALARAVEKRALSFRIVRPQALPSARASA